MFPEIHVLNICIPMYPLCVAIGFFVSTVVLDKLSVKIGLSEKEVFPLMCFIEVSTIIGGKLFFLLINFDKVGDIFYKYGIIGVITKTGFVFYGALIFGIFSCFLFSQIYKINKTTTFSAALLITPLIHSFGRIGCFCAGCCYGIKYTGLFSIRMQGVYRFPVQLLEAFLNLIIFLLLLQLSNRNKKLITPCYFLFYGILRLITEQLRGDVLRGFIGVMSISSYISILLIILGILFCFIQEKNKKG